MSALASVQSRKPAQLGLLTVILMAGLLASAGALAQWEPEDLRGPDVTIIAGEERTYQEYRQGDVLRMVRVVPIIGRPYYLVPSDPTSPIQDMEQSDSFRARWILLEF